MSCNIYDEPTFVQKVRYGPRLRPGQDQDQDQDKEERVVEIYESAGNGGSPHCKAPRGPQIRSGPDSDRFKVVSAGLGLLCLLLLIIIGFFAYRHYVAETEAPPPPQTNATAAGLCAGGWLRFRCSCFLVSSERRNWTESRADCEDRGAHLAVIDSRDKKEFVLTLEMEEELWIGLFYEGKWSWVSGSTLGFRSWVAGCNAAFAVKQGAAAFIVKDGNWDHSTEGLRRWLCEKDI